MQVKELLEVQYDQYNNVGFISEDPISIPHRFTLLQDIEIAAFFSATIAWGQRKSIIKSAKKLMSLMDSSPYQFILHHEESDLINFQSFCHRTFQPEDVIYFIRFLNHHYQQSDTLETAFTDGHTTEAKLNNFKSYFFSLPNYPKRTKKHIASPLQKSSCKRLNMFLRWMVRNDDRNVDFGLWKNIPIAELICPLDVHVGRVARELGLLKRKQNDWAAAIELTKSLQLFDPKDPVKYDFALFGTGIDDKIGNKLK